MYIVQTDTVKAILMVKYILSYLEFYGFLGTKPELLRKISSKDKNYFIV